MVATSIYFNGRLINVPGSYSEVDASGLESIGLGAVGIVGLIAEGEGGRPVTSDMVIADFITLSRAEHARQQFRSGPMREGAAVLFQPSSDEEIQAGASLIYAMKTNQATRASKVFGNTYGDCVTITSEDYMEAANQINIEIQTGTTQGKLLTIVLESVEESIDNLGGIGGTDTQMFTLQYTEPAGLGWDTMRAQVMPGGVQAHGVRVEPQLIAEKLSAGTTAGGSVVSNNAADTTMKVTVYGLVGGTPTREQVTLNGTATVPLNNLFDIGEIWACEMDSIAAGTVTVSDGTPTVILSMATTVLQSGGKRATTMFVANSPVNMVYDIAGAGPVWLVGRNAAGAWTIEQVTMDGTAPVTTAVTDWTEISFIVLTECTAATTVTINAVAVQTVTTTQNTLTKIADFFNSRQATISSVAYGFVFTVVTSLTTLASTSLDLTDIPVDIDNPVTGSFYADLFYFLDYLNSSAALVDAAKTTFQPRIDDITITPLDATAYTVTINGVGVVFTSGSGATVASIRAGLTQQLNATAGAGFINSYVTASTNVADLRITSDTPVGYTISVGANLALASVQTQNGSGQVPDNTSAPEYLIGGSEGVSSAADYQTALNLLKQVFVNTIVVMTGDAAVHAALKAHNIFMGGIGRKERDGCVGLYNSALTALPSKTEIQSQIVDLNTRHIRAFAQNIERFDTAQERVTMGPEFVACMAAGMQAGSDVGVSLTYKFADCLSVTQDSTWNPIDDAGDMIDRGLCFLEEVPGIGRRWVRNITTHLQSSNLAFIEASVNEAVNFAVFSFRTNMEYSVGRKGFSGTLNGAKALAIGTLGLLVDAEVLVAYQSLSLELAQDVLEVSAQMSPVIPINFVKNTIHLVTIRQAA